MLGKYFRTYQVVIPVNEYDRKEPAIHTHQNDHLLTIYFKESQKKDLWSSGIV